MGLPRGSTTCGGTVGEVFLHNLLIPVLLRTIKVDYPLGLLHVHHTLRALRGLVHLHHVLGLGGHLGQVHRSSSNSIVVHGRTGGGLWLLLLLGMLWE